MCPRLQKPGLASADARTASGWTGQHASACVTRNVHMVVFSTNGASVCVASRDAHMVRSLTNGPASACVAKLDAHMVKFSTNGASVYLCVASRDAHMVRS